LSYKVSQKKLYAGLFIYQHFLLVKLAIK